MYMCNWAGKLKDPWKIVCCREGENQSTSIYCQPNDMNLCSPTLEKSDFLFYTYCPNISQQMCGAQDMKLEAKNIV